MLLICLSQVLLRHPLTVTDVTSLFSGRIFILSTRQPDGATANLWALLRPITQLLGAGNMKK